MNFYKTRLCDMIVNETTIQQCLNDVDIKNIFFY